MISLHFASIAGMSLISDGLVHVEIVVEAAVYGRAYGDLCRREKRLDGLRHDVRGRRRVKRQNRAMKTLVNISREFSSILDLNVLLGKIASTIRELISYDAFSILLIDREAKALRHHFSIRYDQRVDIDNVPLEKGLTGSAADSKQVVRVHDTLTDPRYIASHPDIRSEVAVPLMVRDRVIGVMDIENERIGHFTDDHVRLLEAARAAGCQQRGKRAALRRDRRARTPHGRDLQAARQLQQVSRTPSRRFRGWNAQSGCVRRARSAATYTR